MKINANITDLIATLEKLRPTDYEDEDRDVYFLYRGKDEGIQAAIEKVEEWAANQEKV